MVNPSHTAGRLLELVTELIEKGERIPGIKQLALILEVTETEIKDAKTLLVRQKKVIITKSERPFGPDQFVIQGNAPIVPVRRQVRELGWEERHQGISGRHRRDIARARHADITPMTPEDTLAGLTYRAIDAGIKRQERDKDFIANWGPIMMSAPRKAPALKLAPKPACENCGEAFVPLEEWEVHCICCTEDADWPSRGRGIFGNYQ